MRTVGVWLVIIGIIWAIVAFNMNTAVHTSSYEAVNNIGLMDDRRNHLMFSGLTILAGVILIGFGSVQRSVRGNKPCPFCAELIQPVALKCRYCSSELPESFRAAPADVPTESNFATVVAVNCAILGIGAIVFFASTSSKNSVVARSPAPPAPSAPGAPLVYSMPALDDPRAAQLHQACVNGKAQIFVGGKWQPDTTGSDLTPVSCVVMPK